MNDTPPGGLTPPGPPIEPTPGGGAGPGPQKGGMSLEDWLATQQAVTGPQRRAAPARVEPPSAWRPFDRVSLWAFVLACSAFGGPVAVVLGIVGLRRTNDDAVAGRWAAITGIALGLFSTLAVTAALVGLTWFHNNVKPVSRVEAGDCVDIGEEDGVVFYPVDCSDPHHAEVGAAGDFDAQLVDGWRLNSRTEFCRRQLDDGLSAALTRSGPYGVVAYVDADDPGWPELGDAWACVLVRRDGTPLDQPVGTGGWDR